MPLYLCESCARSNFKPDLTEGGVSQIWVRSSKGAWFGAEHVDTHGFGPRCDVCDGEKTVFQIQIIGTKHDAEGVITERMRQDFLKSKIST